MDRITYKGLLVISVFFILTGPVSAGIVCPAPCGAWMCWNCCDPPACTTSDPACNADECYCNWPPSCGGGCFCHCGCGTTPAADGIYVRQDCGGAAIYPNMECCWIGSCDLSDGGCINTWSSDYEVAWNLDDWVCCNFNSIWLRGHKPDADWKCTPITAFDSTEVMDGISGAIYTETNSRGDVGNALTCWSFAAGARVCGDDACYNVNTQQCWAGGDVRSEIGGPCKVGTGTDCVAGAVCCGGTCVAAPGWDVDLDGHISDQCDFGDDCDDSKASVYLGHDEECDCLDNDCDGLIDGADHSGPTDIDTTPTRPMCTAVGVCIGHQKLCIDAIAGPGCVPQWVDCDTIDYIKPESGIPACDGKDNDCDGLTDAADPDLPGTGPACTSAGVCMGFTKLCVGSSWIDCDAPGYENPEVTCDGLDNDCNSQWDEPCDCDDAKPTCELALPMKDCRDALCTGAPGGSCWSVGGEIAATTCCGDDATEFYKYYDQNAATGCNDVTDESCVNQPDDTSDHACCNSVMDCVLNFECHPTDDLVDIDGDGYPGEYCLFTGGTGKWDDCDSGGGACTGTCGYTWANDGEATEFGEYEVGAGTECCGDDPFEYYVGGTDGTYACCDNKNTPAGVSLAWDECVIGGECKDRISSPEICDDLDDNDCDGKTDCDDPNCAGEMGPSGKICCPNGVGDCISVFDDCKIEQCIAKECETSDRPQCAQDECGISRYCDIAGGDCTNPDDNTPKGITVCTACAGGTHINNPYAFEKGNPYCCGDDADEILTGGIGCCAPGAIGVTPAGVCLRCQLGYPCEACSGWVTRDTHVACPAPYNDCVLDSGTGYYDWACCTGVICKIQKQAHT